ERLTAQLMLALHRSGRSGEALAAFATLARRLDADLGVDPGDEVASIERAIRRADSALLPAELPVPVSSFVGRQREMAEAAELLRRSRLLMLAGPGGCGKSRLALELARRAAAGHPDGVFLVDLSGLGSSGSVAGAVAQALGIGEQDDEPTEATLVRTL